MRKCCVPGCGNRLNLHSVPYTKPAAQWQIWLSICPFLSRYSLKQLDSTKICNLHFQPKYINEKKRLTADAIPSLNLPPIPSSELPKHDTVLLATTKKKYLEISSLSADQPFNVKVVDCIPTEFTVTDNTAVPPLGSKGTPVCTVHNELIPQLNVNSDQLSQTLNRDTKTPHNDSVRLNSHPILLPTLETLPSPDRSSATLETLPISPDMSSEESYEQSAVPSVPTSPSIEDQTSQDFFHNKLDSVACDNSGLRCLTMECCVDFCSNTLGKVSTRVGYSPNKHEAVSFYGFPSEAHLRAAWLRALGKQDCQLPASAVVCSQHFLHDDICETEGGARQLRTGAVPSTVLVCMICFNTDSKMFLMSQYKLEDTYEKLTGYPLSAGGNLKQTLCVQCAQRLRNFSRFREQSLRARCLMMELLEKHELITMQHIKMIDRVKYQLNNDFVLKTIEPDHWDLYIEENYDENTQMDSEDVQSIEVNSGCDESVLIDDMNSVGNVSDDPLKLESMCDVEQEVHPPFQHHNLSTRFIYSVDNLASKDVSCQAPSDNEDNTRYTCKVCGIGFKQKHLLVNHMKIHTKTEQWYCKLCIFKSKYQSVLIKHNMQNHMYKPYACKLCESKTKNKTNFIRHICVLTPATNNALVKANSNAQQNVISIFT